MSQHNRQSPRDNNRDEESLSSSCIICFELIETSTRAVAKDCAHEFCVSCIHSWLERNSSCPLCKQTITSLLHSFSPTTGEATEQIVDVEKCEKAPKEVPTVEEELQCLDHAFFSQEVHRLLSDADRLHRQLWTEGKSARNNNPRDKQRLSQVEDILANLRTYKRKLQAMLPFDPLLTLQHLYKMEDDLRSCWHNNSVVVGGGRANSVAAPAPRKVYSADDADTISDEDDDYYDDFPRTKQPTYKGKHKINLAKLSGTSASRGSR
eukprot:TRINITY_DN4065_c0_g1_i2.p1 TRINITY_DN4065_c0_g1~~TRINITY_DN4065_c0_g1_i2.p1  ORF type:complete len:265 (+),score=52.53 TRINITY_DN4065_c0_g1_i2:151-945(+)